MNWNLIGRFALPARPGRQPGNSAVIHLISGDFKQALSLAGETLRIGLRTDDPWGQLYGRSLTGCVYWEYGEARKAISAREDAIRLSKQGGLSRAQVMFWADLAWVYAGLTPIEHGLELAPVALSKSDKNHGSWRAVHVNRGL